MSNLNDLTTQPLPPTKIGQIKRFARDIAWKILNREIEYVYYSRNTQQIIPKFDAPNIKGYVDSVWNNVPPELYIMREMGYFNFVKEAHGDRDLIDYYSITEKAILLLDETPPSTTFISYRRKESSALALLIVARLKENGLSAFLDTHPDNTGLGAGDTWHAELEQQVATNDNFIVLIGPTTLESPYVRQEIRWAVNYGKKIYTVWHNGYQGSQYGIPLSDIDDMKIVTEQINAAIVDLENPKYYTGALYELLLKYGINS